MKALIIGGARSGIGCAHLLNKLGYDVTLATNKDFLERHALENKGIHVTLDDTNESLVQQYDCVVKNPGISNEHPIIKQLLPVLNEIQIAVTASPHYRYFAVSGTNGKTTTVTMLDEMFKKKDNRSLLAGNVGYALSEAVYQDGDFERLVSLEISAFQMEGTPRFEPEVYALMNLSPDHLDRYDSAEDYYAAKCTIIPRAKTFVCNIDDDNIRKFALGKSQNTLTLSLDNDADICVKGNNVVYRDIELFDMSTLKIVGKHNVMNAAFAATLAYLGGVSISDIRSVIATFSGVEHRIEFVKELNGVRYYNDSKATNPESTEVCLDAFDSPVILLAGGYDKHISFELLRKFSDSLKDAYVFGESADQLREVFPNAIKVDTMFDALRMAHGKAVEGDTIVLSPACASYDQFTDFEERGNKFKEYVETLN